jgi:DNA-binding transcriptional LysR family regulator
MTRKNTPLLDLALLQTLVAVERDGSLAKAAARVGRTQSAVSLQMQRLEQLLSVDLFDRAGRSLVLTEAGHAMRAHAERMLALNSEAVSAVRGHRVAGQVSLGMSVDFEHTWLPQAMARFSRSHPKIQVDLRLDRNTALERAVTEGEIDMAVIFGTPSPTDRAAIGSVPMAWIGRENFVRPPDANLPLLLLEAPCLFRTAALKALEEAGIPWRLAVTSPSLGGLWATALAGMGVTVRSGIMLPPGLANVGAHLGLPALPKVAVRILESDSRATPPRTTLRKLLRDLAGEFIGPA